MVGIINVKLKLKGEIGMTPKRMMVLALVIGFLVCGNGSAFSQSAPTAPSEDTVQIFLEKIRADKKLVVAAVMELTDTEAKAFWPVYDGYQKELHKINEATAKLILNFADNYQSMSDSAADKLVKDSLAIDIKRYQLKKDFLPKFTKVIPKTKVLKYYQLENKIQLALNYELSSRIPLLR